MKHFIEFVEPGFGIVEITKPHGFNHLDLESGRTTYLEVRSSCSEAFGKLIAASRRHGIHAVANYIYRGESNVPLVLNICFSRVQTDGVSYFGMYVNDYSPAVFQRIG
jgi:hypothetical protein